MPQVCKFWRQGHCKFGDNCKFQHYEGDSRTSSRNNFGNQRADQYESRGHNGYQSNNSYRGSNSRQGGDAYQGNSNQSRGNTSQRSVPAPDGPKYNLDKSIIHNELTSERPQWILSAFSPSRDLPVQLCGGLLEQSCNEMRLRYYEAAANGNPQQAVAEAEQLHRDAERQHQNIVNDLDGAIAFVNNAENKPGNRFDVIKQSHEGTLGASQPNPLNNPMPFQSAPPSNPFGAFSNQPAAPSFSAPSAQSGAFGATSGPNPIQNPFGSSTPAFGAPTGAFGQPSMLGQKPNPFGAPSVSPAPFANTAPAPASFGQPTPPVTNNAFGAPSSQQPFGAPSGSGFGQPAAIPNPFSQQPTTTNAFGASSSQPPFGAPSGSVFGQKSAAPPNTFGNQSTTSNPAPFGASSTPQPSAFGGNTLTPSALTQPSLFGQQPVPQSNLNPFGLPQTSSNTVAAPSGQKSSSLGPASTTETKGMTITEDMIQHPPLSSYCTKDASGRVLSWKGMRVEYRRDELDDEIHPGYINGGSWVKIWHPNGPPTDVDIGLPKDIVYDQQTIEAYAYAMKYGRFKDGLVPKLPPKQTWIRYDV